MVLDQLMPASLMSKGRYEIKLHGTLGQQWQTKFEGFELSTAHGQTRIVGEVVDQAELYGLLRSIRDIGLPLLLLRRID